MSTNSLATTTQTPAPVQIGFGDAQSFDLIQRVAKCFSLSTLVPKDYQNNLPNCVIALNMASRMGADPMMCMQNLVIVHGRPGWSAQFLIATFNKCGRFSAIRYEFTGQEGTDAWGCRAKATELATGEVLVGTTVTIAMAKKEGWYQKNGSKWQTMPEQMLMYRAASWFVRAYAPEIAVGLQTAEEMRDTYELEREGEAFVLPAKGQTSSDLNAMLHAETAPTVLVEVKSEQPGPERVKSEQELQDERDFAERLAAKKGRPTAVELEEMRADMIAELETEGLALAEIEKQVGEYANRWTPKHIEKIRGVIVPNLKSELMGV